MNRSLEAPTSKEALRNHYRRLLSSLTEERKKEARDACFTFLSSGFTDSFQVASFASKATEINLWPLNEWLCSNKKLILPKVQADTLQLYKVVECSELVISRFSIFEPHPIETNLAAYEELDVVLVPGLCFDQNFQRIGYGKGHYDRLLPQIRKANSKALIWGIGFKEQLSAVAFEMQDHDERLDDLYLF